MKNIIFTNGIALYDFFVIPTVRYNTNGCCKYITVEWLRWYVGIKWYT